MNSLIVAAVVVLTPGVDVKEAVRRADRDSKAVSYATLRSLVEAGLEAKVAIGVSAPDGFLAVKADAAVAPGLYEVKLVNGVPTITPVATQPTPVRTAVKKVIGLAERAAELCLPGRP